MRIFFIKATTITRAGRHRGEGDYAARLELVSELQEAGVAVPLVIGTCAGELYTKEDGYYIEVHEFFEDAENYTGKEGQLESVARVMAQFHTAFDAMQGPAAKRVRKIGGLHDGKADRVIPSFTDACLSYEQDLPLVPNAALREYLRLALPNLREEYAKMGEASREGLDIGLGHGDLHQGQVLFDRESGEFLAAIDWEGARNLVRAFDMGYAMDRASIPGDPAELKTKLDRPLETFAHDPKRVDAFMGSYLAVRDFSDRDLRAISSELQRECVNRSAGFLEGIFGAAREKDTSFNYTKLHGFLRIMSPLRMAGLEQHLVRG